MSLEVCIAISCYLENIQIYHDMMVVKFTMFQTFQVIRMHTLVGVKYSLEHTIQIHRNFGNLKCHFDQA